MAQSSIVLLGAFQVRCNGTAVTHFLGDKVRALLAYVAVEADRPHPRTALAGLFWPEQPEGQALRNFSQALARELGSQRNIAYALANLGDVTASQGRYDRAEEHLQESLLLAKTLGDRYLLLGNLAEHAKLAAVRGQAGRAARLGGAEARLRDELGMAFPIGELTRREQALERARAQLGERSFQRAWYDGQAMTLDEAVAYALEQDSSLVGPLESEVFHHDRRN